MVFQFWLFIHSYKKIGKMENLTSSLAPMLITGNLHAHTKGKGRLLLLEEEVVVPWLVKGIKRVKVELHQEVFHLAFQNSKTLGRYLMLSESIMKFHEKHGGSLSGTLSVFISEDDTELQFQHSETLEAVFNQDAEAENAFNQLTAGKKRGLIYWIEQAKSPDVRIKRALETAEKLKLGDSNFNKARQ